MLLWPGARALSTSQSVWSPSPALRCLSSPGFVPAQPHPRAGLREQSGRWQPPELGCGCRAEIEVAPCPPVMSAKSGVVPFVPPLQEAKQSAQLIRSASHIGIGVQSGSSSTSQAHKLPFIDKPKADRGMANLTSLLRDEVTTSPRAAQHRLSGFQRKSQCH